MKMDCNTFFGDICKKINDSFNNHDKFNFGMGWCFLYTSKATFHPAQQLFFIASNPKGEKNEKYPDPGQECSCENGNDFRVGEWIKGKPGQSFLQLQVQELFKRIKHSMEELGVKVCYEKLMDNSLAANYVPFRSENEDSIKDKEIMEFSNKRWKEVFNYIMPKVIICMSKLSFEGIKKVLLKEKGFYVSGTNERMKLGYGKAFYEMQELKNGDSSILLVRLPHLSHYKIFSRRSDECVKNIKRITDKIARVLDAKAFI